MAKKLTARQREVLELIIKHIAERGFPPSIRELGAALKISSLRGVTVHLDALERKGWIRRERVSRGIQVLAPLPSSRGRGAAVPVLGTIAAGVPILAVENVESYITVPEEIAGRSNNLLALRVWGESMIGDGIMPGDTVIVRPQRNVASGELAAVLLGDEATVKRARFEHGKATLESSNPHYPPMEIARDDAMIIGKVVGLIRNY
ncbi:MAG: transcriptional repressor LexA [Armatimonadetes bacterium]|nr:transcriptional repressor LexA [Armatimonadota bacterium]